MISKLFLMQKSAQYAPKLLALPLKVTPFFIEKKILTPLFNQTFLAQRQDDELDFLTHKIMQIYIKDLNYRLNISVINQEIVVLPVQQKPDVILSANHTDLVYMIVRYEDPDTLFFKRKLMIEGETALGLAAKNWLDSLEFDILPSWIQSFLHRYANELQKLDTRTIAPNRSH